MTSKSAIRDWFEKGIDKKATHMLVVCDSFDYEDYPVYVSKDEDVNDIIKKYDSMNMQRVMEVYNLLMDIDKQISEHRSWHTNILKDKDIVNRSYVLSYDMDLSKDMIFEIYNISAEKLQKIVNNLTLKLIKSNKMNTARLLHQEIDNGTIDGKFLMYLANAGLKLILDGNKQFIKPDESLEIENDEQCLGDCNDCDDEYCPNYEENEEDNNE